jgi:hypothetical protein
MTTFLAQAMSDLTVIQEVSKRLDLVGLLVMFFVCLWKKVIVMGWTYEATERRLAEADKLGDRLIEIQMRTLEASDARRQA